jgi:glycerol-3-phosphate cytidylyltransferase
MKIRVITFGTFDVFHVGHLNILRRAKELGDYLIVGVSSDALNFSKKARYPVYPESERMAIVASVRYADQVFSEESLELKAEYIRRHKADRLVMGDDWVGRFDDLKNICEVIYLPRTEGVSTTQVMARIKKYE